MSQQGGRPTGHEDDWWAQLYDDSTQDTGPAAAADTLDDRFASAAGTLGRTVRAAGAANTPPSRPPSPSRVVAPPRTADPAEEPDPAPEDRQTEAADGRPPEVTDDQPPEVTDDQPPEVTEDRQPEVTDDRGPAGTWLTEATDDPSPPSRLAEDADEPAGDGPDWWRHAPWEAPAAAPAGPVTFPSGSRPPERTAPATDARTPQATGGPASPDTTARPVPTAPSVPAAPPLPAGPPPPSAPPRPVAPPPPPETPHAVPASSTTAGDRYDTDTDNYADTDADTYAYADTDAADGPLDYVGSGPPTYDAEPTALPLADPGELDDLVPDTVLDGARYGACTLRAVSIRGDSARFRGEPRRDALLTARFGAGEQALVLVALATGARAVPGSHRAAAELCEWIARAVGRSHARLVEDIRAGLRGDLKSGLHRLTDRSLGRLRAGAVEQGIAPEEHAATLRCLLLPADPECRARVFFGVGAGGLFRLRDGEWQDIEPQVTESPGDLVVARLGSRPAETLEGDRLTMDLGIPTPPSPYEPAPEPPREPFRFRASVARPGDTLLMCSDGLAEPLRGEPELCAYLARRWSRPAPPGLAAFLADAQVRVKGYADDRTAAAVWEA